MENNYKLEAEKIRGENLDPLGTLPGCAPALIKI